MDLRGTFTAAPGGAWYRPWAILLAVATLAAFGDASSVVAQPAFPTVAAAQPKDAKLFLAADTVTYDTRGDVVTATGGVQIDYGKYKLVARRLIYNQKTRRLVAVGDVELKQPDGNLIYADQIDVTDDFRDGFVEALRLETPENTRFAAAQAVRENGDTTTFERGVYTACEPCREHPERPPLWQIKARRIIWDEKEKVIRYYGARFELFGAPIAYLPYFQSADPTVKRQSGFLAPEFKNSDDLGYGLRVPYFMVLNDSADVTVAGTYYTKQGFLGEAEYRQAFDNGMFTLKTAGIIQQDQDEFSGDNIYENGILARESPDYANKARGMIGTTGKFALSDRWTFGWDVLWQSDEDFSNTYGIAGYGDSKRVSEVYLTGLGDQSYFDLRAQKFQYQSTDTDLDDQQPYVLPSLDYERIEQTPDVGGEVKLTANLASIYRSKDAVTRLCNTYLTGGNDPEDDCASPFNGYQFNPDYLRYNGLDGSYTRASTELEWRNSYILPSGLVLTPIASVRGDLYTADMASDGSTLPFYTAGVLTSNAAFGAVDIDDSGARGMATAALEARYPYLIETAYSSHVIEPIAQIVVRPNETLIGQLPNEDAQTLVFNTANLFSLDKFSGYDRIEGGTRANVGLKYSGSFVGGYSIDAVVGQSYHLAGINSYAQRDLSLVGYDSGLETDRSDYVGSLSLGMPEGISLGTQGRFDEADFALKRADFYGSYQGTRASGYLAYSFIAAQPIYGSVQDQNQINAGASLKFDDNWTAYGLIGYDIENKSVIRQGVAVGWANDCYSMLLSYEDENSSYSSDSGSQTVMFKVGLRTLTSFNEPYDIGL
ncbi:LPS-assembly protein LptD [Jiella sonneratiae]|uniref:LPS-assembly protein LptD n=1 Tax=Jiella sonneratiae TaxID=2816856 RepID=A0ABS3JB82_9HYPH|nr:LPS-assembly protein LptD [Jiella sonneratiae]MBO0906218.1 LPS-assembly protein LptD [Jiella sonneratiae]